MTAFGWKAFRSMRESSSDRWRRVDRSVALRRRHAKSRMFSTRSDSIASSSRPSVSVSRSSTSRERADTTMVVLVPESGDSIQTLKAGVMEIADVFVVNKSDRPGADRLRNDVELMLGLRKGIDVFEHACAPRRRSQAHHEPSARRARGSRGSPARRNGLRRFCALLRRRMKDIRDR